MRAKSTVIDRGYKMFRSHHSSHRTRMPISLLLILLPLWVTVFAISAFAQKAPLKTYRQGAGNDTFAVATPLGEQAAQAAGYRPVRIEGYLFSHPRPGTVPLKLFSHRGSTPATAVRLPDRIAAMHQCRLSDDLTAATPAGEREALAAGYEFVRVEGYIYPNRQPGTVPLKLFWHIGRNDNLTTATAEGEREALAAGYQFIRIEGYVFPGPQTTSATAETTTAQTVPNVRRAGPGKTQATAELAPMVPTPQQPVPGRVAAKGGMRSTSSVQPQASSEKIPESLKAQPPQPKQYGPFTVVNAEVSTNIHVRAGSVVRVVATGEVDFGGDVLGRGAQVRNADGDSSPTAGDYPGPNLRKNSLICRVGGVWYQGGTDKTFTVSTEGILILRPNDNTPSDNRRGWSVNVYVTGPR